MHNFYLNIGSGILKYVVIGVAAGIIILIIKIRKVMMKKNIDNGYISEFLIHWAGRSKPTPIEKSETLSSIITDCRLRLSSNLFISALGVKLKTEMVSFTDVPLHLSKRHCSKYSTFGIAFYKQKLMGKGAQPVFYSTHVFIRDMDKIYRFMLDQQQKLTLRPDVFDALFRHFFCVQDFSEGSADSHDAHYYEREWRLGEMTLVPEGEDRAKWCLKNALPICIGDLVKVDGERYFQFEKQDVAFIVVPEKYTGHVKNPDTFPVRTFESLVSART
jgi:hypothetical protein